MANKDKAPEMVSIERGRAERLHQNEVNSTAVLKKLESMLDFEAIGVFFTEEGNVSIYTCDKELVIPMETFIRMAVVSNFKIPKKFLEDVDYLTL